MTVSMSGTSELSNKHCKSGVDGHVSKPRKIAGSVRTGKGNRKGRPSPTEVS